MKSFFVLASVLLCLGVLSLLAPPETSAQILVPCCEGGWKPGKKCNTDSNCPNVCIGGFRDGKPCNNAGTNCPSACVGGSRSGDQCYDDLGCPGGTCGDPGTCMVGACTDLCEKKPPKPTPSEPVSGWEDLPGSFDLDQTDRSPRPCP